MKRLFTSLILIAACLSGVQACAKKSPNLAYDTAQLCVGFVMDTTQALLPDAKVTIANRSRTTSWDGRFVFEAKEVQPHAKKQLVITCDGYCPLKIALAEVNWSKPLIVKLIPTGEKKKDKISLGSGSGHLLYTRSKGGEIKATLATVEYDAVAESADMYYSVDKADGMTRPYYRPTANEATAGKLTAGEVNDFTKWDFWQTVLNDSHKQYVPTWRITAQNRYTVQLVNEQGYPIASRAVSLIDEKGATLFQAVTDNTGKAELWLHLTGKDQLASNNLQIRVDNRIVPARPWAEGVNTIVLNEPCEHSDGVDVLFVFDATGSMGDELRYLQAEMKDVIARAANATGGLTIRTGAVVYRDHGDDYITRLSRLTEDITETQAFIDKQEANGGGDYPEAVPEALMAALNTAGWDASARARIAFLILDAPCHEDSATIALLHEQVRNAAAFGVRIVPVVCSGIGESGELLMRSIALATNGTSFFLTDDSGIGLPHLKPTTDSLKVEHLNDMLVRTIVEFSLMPQCEASEDDPFTLIDESVIPNPFDPEDLERDPSIPHGEGVHYLLDVSGKLIGVYKGEMETAQQAVLHLPKGVYFIKTFLDGRWYTRKVLVN